MIQEAIKRKTFYGDMNPERNLFMKLKQFREQQAFPEGNAKESSSE